MRTKTDQSRADYIVKAASAALLRGKGDAYMKEAEKYPEFQSLYENESLLTQDEKDEYIGGILSDEVGGGNTYDLIGSVVDGLPVTEEEKEVWRGKREACKTEVGARALLGAAFRQKVGLAYEAHEKKQAEAKKALEELTNQEVEHFAAVVAGKEQMKPDVYQKLSEVGGAEMLMAKIGQARRFLYWLQDKARGENMGGFEAKVKEEARKRMEEGQVYIKGIIEPLTQEEMEQQVRSEWAEGFDFSREEMNEGVKHLLDSQGKIDRGVLGLAVLGASDDAKGMQSIHSKFWTRLGAGIVDSFEESGELFVRYFDDDYTDETNTVAGLVKMLERERLSPSEKGHFLAQTLTNLGTQVGENAPALAASLLRGGAYAAGALFVTREINSSVDEAYFEGVKNPELYGWVTGGFSGWAEMLGAGTLRKTPYIGQLIDKGIDVAKKKMLNLPLIYNTIEKIKGNKALEFGYNIAGESFMELVGEEVVSQTGSKLMLSTLRGCGVEVDNIEWKPFEDSWEGIKDLSQSTATVAYVAAVGLLGKGVNDETAYETLKKIKKVKLGFSWEKAEEMDKREEESSKQITSIAEMVKNEAKLAGTEKERTEIINKGLEEIRGIQSAYITYCREQYIDLITNNPEQFKKNLEAEHKAALSELEARILHEEGVLEEGLKAQGVSTERNPDGTIKVRMVDEEKLETDKSKWENGEKPQGYEEPVKEVEWSAEQYEVFARWLLQEEDVKRMKRIRSRALAIDMAEHINTGEYAKALPLTESAAPVAAALNKAKGSITLDVLKALSKAAAVEGENGVEVLPGVNNRIVRNVERSAKERAKWAQRQGDKKSAMKFLQGELGMGAMRLPSGDNVSNRIVYTEGRTMSGALVEDVLESVLYSKLVKEGGVDSNGELTEAGQEWLNQLWEEMRELDTKVRAMQSNKLKKGVFKGIEGEATLMNVVEGFSHFAQSAYYQNAEEGGMDERTRMHVVFMDRALTNVRYLEMLKGGYNEWIKSEEGQAWVNNGGGLADLLKEGGHEVSRLYEQSRINKENVRAVMEAQAMVNEYNGQSVDAILEKLGVRKEERGIRQEEVIREQEEEREEDSVKGEESDEGVDEESVSGQEQEGGEQAGVSDDEQSEARAQAEADELGVTLLDKYLVDEVQLYVECLERVLSHKDYPGIARGEWEQSLGYFTAFRGFNEGDVEYLLKGAQKVTKNILAGKYSNWVNIAVEKWGEPIDGVPAGRMRRLIRYYALRERDGVAPEHVVEDPVSREEVEVVPEEVEMAVEEEVAEVQEAIKEEQEVADRSYREEVIAKWGGDEGAKVLFDLVDRVKEKEEKGEKLSHKWHEIGDVPEVVIDVGRGGVAKYKIDLRGYKLAIDETHIKHAMRRHGQDKGGQVALEWDDFKVLLDIVNSSDIMEMNKGDEGKPGSVKFKKRYGEYEYIATFHIGRKTRSGKDSIRFATEYIKKKVAGREGDTPSTVPDSIPVSPSEENLAQEQEEVNDYVSAEREVEYLRRASVALTGRLVEGEDPETGGVFREPVVGVYPIVRNTMKWLEKMRESGEADLQGLNRSGLYEKAIDLMKVYREVMMNKKVLGNFLRTKEKEGVWYMVHFEGNLEYITEHSLGFVKAAMEGPKAVCDLLFKALGAFVETETKEMEGDEKASEQDIRRVVTGIESYRVMPGEPQSDEWFEVALMANELLRKHGVSSDGYIVDFNQLNGALTEVIEWLGEMQEELKKGDSEKLKEEGIVEKWQYEKAGAFVGMVTRALETREMLDELLTVIKTERGGGLMRLMKLGAMQRDAIHERVMNGGKPCLMDTAITAGEVVQAIGRRSVKPGVGWKTAKRKELSKEEERKIVEKALAITIGDDPTRDNLTFQHEIVHGGKLWRFSTDGRRAGILISPAPEGMQEGYASKGAPRILNAIPQKNPEYRKIWSMDGLSFLKNIKTRKNDPKNGVNGEVPLVEMNGKLERYAAKYMVDMYKQMEALRSLGFPEEVSVEGWGGEDITPLILRARWDSYEYIHVLMPYKRDAIYGLDELYGGILVNRMADPEYYPTVDTPYSETIRDLRNRGIGFYSRDMLMNGGDTSEGKLFVLCYEHEPVYDSYGTVTRAVTMLSNASLFREKELSRVLNKSLDELVELIKEKQKEPGMNTVIMPGYKPVKTYEEWKEQYEKKEKAKQEEAKAEEREKSEEERKIDIIQKKSGLSEQNARIVYEGMREAIAEGNYGLIYDAIGSKGNKGSRCSFELLTGKKVGEDAIATMKEVFGEKWDAWQAEQERKREESAAVREAERVLNYVSKTGLYMQGDKEHSQGVVKDVIDRMVNSGRGVLNEHGMRLFVDKEGDKVPFKKGMLVMSRKSKASKALSCFNYNGPCVQQVSYGSGVKFWVVAEVVTETYWKSDVDGTRRQVPYQWVNIWGKFGQEVKEYYDLVMAKRAEQTGNASDYEEREAGEESGGHKEELLKALGDGQVSFTEASELDIEDMDRYASEDYVPDIDYEKLIAEGVSSKRVAGIYWAMHNIFTPEGMRKYVDDSQDWKRVYLSELIKRREIAIELLKAGGAKIENRAGILATNIGSVRRGSDYGRSKSKFSADDCLRDELELYMELGWPLCKGIHKHAARFVWIRGGSGWAFIDVDEKNADSNQFKSRGPKKVGLSGKAFFKSLAEHVEERMLYSYRENEPARDESLLFDKQGVRKISKKEKEVQIEEAKGEDEVGVVNDEGVVEEKKAELEEREKTSNVGKKELQDTGRHIFARKDKYRTGLSVEYSAMIPEGYRVSDINVSQYMPKLNYKKLAEAGMDRRTLAVLAYLTETLGARPIGGEWSSKVREWKKRFEMRRPLCAGLLDGSIRAEDVINTFKTKAIESTEGYSASINTAEKNEEANLLLWDAIGYPDCLELKKAKLEAGNGAFYDFIKGAQSGYYLHADSKQTYKKEEEQAYRAAKHNARESFEEMVKDAKKFLEAWSLAKGASKEKAGTEKQGEEKLHKSIGLFRHLGAKYETLGYYVGVDTGARTRLRLSDDFKEAKEGFEYMTGHVKELNEKRKRLMKMPGVKAKVDGTRIGKNWRGEEAVTTERFMKDFGISGVVYGNWVDVVQRQAKLNETYDAFKDLADLLGMPDKAISLHGELGMMFGANGFAGASAHYESGSVAINLTRDHGDGSLAHEWMHALDNYFMRQAGYGLSMSSETKDIKGMNEEAKGAFMAIISAINSSNLRKRSEAADRSRGKTKSKRIKTGAKGEYFGSMPEMLARCFEGYVTWKLEQRGERNDYLVSYGKQTKFDAEDAEYMKANEDASRYPYPTERELEETFGPLFDRFFKSLTHTEDESGKVVTFNMEDEGLRGEMVGSNDITMSLDIWDEEHEEQVKGRERKLATLLNDIRRESKRFKRVFELDKAELHIRAKAKPSEKEKVRERGEKRMRTTQAIEAMGNALAIMNSVNKYVEGRYRPKLRRWVKLVEVYARMLEKGRIANTSGLEKEDMERIKEEYMGVLREESAIKSQWLEGKSQEEYWKEAEKEEKESVTRMLGARKLPELLNAMLKEAEEALVGQEKEREIEKMGAMMESVLEIRVGKSGKALRGVTGIETYRELEEIREMMGVSGEEAEARKESARGEVYDVNDDERDEDLREHKVKLWHVFGAIKEKSLEEVRVAASELESIVLQGKCSWLEKQEEERQRVQRYINKAVEQLGGFDANKMAEKQAALKRMIGKLGAISNAAKSFGQELYMLSGVEGLKELAEESLKQFARGNIRLTMEEETVHRELESWFKETLGIKNQFGRAKWLGELKKVMEITLPLKVKKSGGLVLSIEDAGKWVNLTQEERDKERARMREEAEKNKRVAENIPEEEDMGEIMRQLNNINEGETRAKYVRIDKTYMQEIGGEMKISKDELLNIWLTYQQPWYTENAEWNGYTAEVLEEIRGILGEDVIAYGEKLRSLLKGDELAREFERREGIPFANHELYWPGHFENPSRSDALMDALMNNTAGLPSTKYSFLIRRLKHKEAPKHNMGATNAFFAAKSQTNSYIIMGELTAMWRRILRNKDFVGGLTKVIGSGGVSTIRSMIDLVDNAHNLDAIASRMTASVTGVVHNAYARSVLSLATTTTIKQTSALVHARSMMKWNEFYPELLTWFMRRKKAISWKGIRELDGIRRARVANRGVDREMYVQPRGGTSSGYFGGLNQAGMNLLAWVDRLANAVSMMMLYNWTYRKKKKENSELSEAELREICEDTVNVSLELVGQPQRLEQKSMLAALGANDTFTKMSMYMNGEIINKLGFALAMLQKKKLEGQIGRGILAMMGWLSTLGLSHQLAVELINLLRGDSEDETEEELLVNLSVSLTGVSVLQALPIMGGLIKEVLDECRAWLGGKKEYYQQTASLGELMYDLDAFTKLWGHLTGEREKFNWTKEGVGLMRSGAVVAEFFKYTPWHGMNKGATVLQGVVQDVNSVLNALRPYMARLNKEEKARKRRKKTQAAW